MDAQTTIGEVAMLAALIHVLAVYLQRLAALVPRPRLNLIRFNGVLAPNTKLRAEIIPGEKKGKKVAHPMRMTMHHIPRLPCVSVGRVC